MALCQRLSAEIAESIGAEVDTANAQAKLHWYRQELSQLTLPGSLPKGVCHADFHFSNVLFKDGNLLDQLLLLQCRRLLNVYSFQKFKAC